MYCGINNKLTAYLTGIFVLVVRLWQFLRLSLHFWYVLIYSQNFRDPCCLSSLEDLEVAVYAVYIILHINKNKITTLAFTHVLITSYTVVLAADVYSVLYIDTKIRVACSGIGAFADANGDRKRERKDREKRKTIHTFSQFNTYVSIAYTYVHSTQRAGTPDTISML